jgi:hypothetical protein
MAEVRCPNCGKNNPDLLDVCQFCQTPLEPESVLRIGDMPTRKNTGELESVLPDWLRDVQQQSKDSAEEEAAQAAAQPKSQKAEPPDLLAGLASQADRADEEEVPDWLANLSSTTNPQSVDQEKPAAPSAPAQGTDFFSQFNQSEPKPASQSAQEEVPFAAKDMSDQMSGAEDKDELSAWFSNAAEQPGEVVEFGANMQDTAWGSNFDSPLPTRQEPAPKEEEDLSWLRNLEEAAKQTGDLKGPRKEIDWNASVETPSMPSQPSASQEDLSWLDSLGGIEEPPKSSSGGQSTGAQNDLSWLDQFKGAQGAQPLDATPKKSPPQEDLSWLKSFGSTPEAAQPSAPEQPIDAAPDQPISSPPFAAEDLDWLKNLPTTSEPSQPVQPFDIPGQEPSASEDLSWLKNLEQASAQSQSLPQEDLSWLKGLGGEPEPLATPPFAETESVPEEKPRRQTSPLGKPEAAKEEEPDWLKSATEAPSMPAPGSLSMDWFNQQEQPLGAAPSTRTSQDKPAEEKPVSPVGTPQPSPFSDLLSTPSEPLSNQDVDSLFSVEMPDWLSQPEPAADELAKTQADLSPTAEESLAPVDLPSWVQAMRPVEAVISETAAGVEDQPEEKEGPLAGLRGVIPGAPLGSSRRPKAITLKLQVTDEQQTSAALLEQILGSETSPRALATPSFIGSQQVLRWALSSVFLLVLSVVILLGSQTMLVPASLPVEASGISDVMLSIPANARVLAVVDYEPSLAGEMEAIAGPLLYQMFTSSQPQVSFVSTSPNGTALVERLVTKARVSQYLNLGYLPGGSAGVLGFVERPGEIISAAEVGSIAEYAAVLVLTDHAESGRVWVEQLQSRKQVDPLLAGQPLLVIASAQAGPLLQPYVSSGQVAGMISGLSDGARYESTNNIPSGLTRPYWDAFGIGLMMAIAAIVIGSLWSVLTGMRARRAEAEQGSLNVH